MHPDLEALLALQERDQAVMATEAALAGLEPELKALDEAEAAAERALAAARAAIQAAIDRRDALEGKIATYRSMQEQRRQRLEWVRGAKEASTLMAELDLARSVLAKEEAEFMRSGDAVTEAERKAAQAGLAAVEARLRDARADAGYRGERLKVVDPGIVPERPSSPNLPLNVAAALLLGAGLPLVYLAFEMTYREQWALERGQMVRSLAQARRE